MNVGHHSKVSEILSVLEARQATIRSRAINLNNFRVIDNAHFTVDGIELFVDPRDTLPVRQLCSQIGMPLGFYRKNPSALNQTIFETHLREVEGRDDEGKRDKGDRLIRYKVHPDGRNQLLSILPTVHQTVPYVDVIRPLVDALPDDAIIRLSNHDQVDLDHRFTLRASFPEFRLEARDNDPLEMGLYLDVSEDGLAKYTMTGFLYRLICENGAMATFDEHPYFEYNHRGIRAIDLGAAVQSAIGRFGDDLQFVHTRAQEATRAVMSKEEMEAFLRDLENHRNVSAGFLRKVRRELVSKNVPHLTRYDVVQEITQQAQTLPHAGRVQHEYLGGRLLGLNLHND
jgi:hypothetical protein